MTDCMVCTSLGHPCLAHQPAPARVWPRETTMEEGACGECGAPMRPCLRGWRCISTECGAIALRRA